MPVAKRRKKQTNSSFMMILLGLSIGLALSLILAIYVIMSPSPFVDKFGVEINSDKNSEPDQSKRLEEIESSEFYELLDGSDNDMSNNNDFLNDDENELQQQSIFMQVGSFASNREADELKARLAIIGIETEIVKIALPDGTLWHRVRIGPILDDQQYTEFKRILSKNGYKYLEIRSNN
jgi:hypothetical protein